MRSTRAVRLLAAATGTVLAAVLLAPAQPAAATTDPTIGSSATRWSVDNSLQWFGINYSTSGSGSVSHYYLNSNDTGAGSELLDYPRVDSLPDDTPSAIEIAGMLHVFYRSGPSLRHAYFKSGYGWRYDTPVASGVGSSPATAIFGGQLHLTYVTTSGALAHRWSNDGVTWLGSNTAVGGDIINRVTPVMGVFAGQLHVLARTSGQWAHFYTRTPNGTAQWGGDWMGQSGVMIRDRPVIAASTSEFSVVGAGTDGKLRRWWYAGGWRQEVVANRVPAGLFHANYYPNAGLHVAYAVNAGYSNAGVYNAWRDSGGWHEEGFTVSVPSSSFDVDTAAHNGSYYIILLENRAYLRYAAGTWRVFRF
ncbi:hypothetical protein AB0M02_17810 [Actinoplanes sp. NPDC051861]|uniref:hypothetical protein n=1 Tax=Actinoplanes sp. NPDC051861 TaxID=3155170 RepID=UPI0034302C1B